MKKKALDDIIKFIPILSLILIIAGNIKFLVYYKEFNLDIFPFIGLDEIVILFMQNALSYLLLFIACVMCLAIFKLKKYKKLPNTFKKRIIKYLDNLKLLALFIFFSIISIIFNILRPQPNFLEVFMIIGAFLVLSYLVPIIVQELIFKFQLQKKSISSLLIFVVFISLTAFSILSAYNEANKVKLGYYKNVEVAFDDFLFKSNLKSFYIGHTQNYIFIYHSEDKSVTSYKMEKVKYINFN